MASDSRTLDYLMILVCAVALVILLAFVVYTWIKWHNQQEQFTPSNEQGPAEIELVGVSAAKSYQRGYLNEVGRDSQNLSGSRTFLGEDVFQQKPFSKGTQPAQTFQIKDVAHYGDVEHNPRVSMDSDVVVHSNGPLSRGIQNETLDGAHSFHAVHDVDKRVERRRWSESTARTGVSNEIDVSHKTNTYL